MRSRPRRRSNDQVLFDVRAGHAPAFSIQTSVQEKASMSNGKSVESKNIRVECITPILRVNSLQVSIRFYVDVLGFRVNWGGEDGSTFASVSRDGRSIMLAEGEQGQRGTWLWIGVEDIEPLFADYKAKGVKFREPPTNYPWAYEMKIEDPDGHVLRLGSDSK
jgi:catechol 2,3-dioxygenase-like lactoylglutathione lyase family enzyme